jgi:integrase
LLKGLYLIVQVSGAKSWAVRYRHHGATRKLTIGAYPLFDMKAARDKAREALRAVAEGRDPGRDKLEAKRATVTIEQLAEDFIEHHCRRHNRPSTVRLAELALRNHVLPHWRGRTAGQITRADIRDVLRKIAATGGAHANRIHAVIRKMFGWAVDEEIVKESPCNGVKRVAQEHDRERVLTDQELGKIWLAAEKIGYPHGDVVKLLALTAQRKSEVVRMAWDELDLSRGIWTLPATRSKNHRSHEVQLSRGAVAILQSVPRIDGSRFVFSLDGKAPIWMSSQAKQRLDMLAGVQDWRLHDLRRSAASGMARLGISPHILDRCLNHVQGTVRGIAAIYNRHDYNDERRAALQTWAKHIASITR